MKLPKSLYVGYKLLKKSRVVCKKEYDPEALEYFQNVLNEAQPTDPEDIIMCRFVKGMYNEHKHKFLSYIKNTSMECLVLWTESKSIVNTMGLRNNVYVKWTGSNTLYTVAKFNSTEKTESNGYPEHPLVILNRETKTVPAEETLVDSIAKPVEITETLNEELDDCLKPLSIKNDESWADIMTK